MGVRQIARAVFFDRDGVLNEAVVRDGVPHPPATLAELRLDPGAIDGTRILRDLGFLRVIVTNQPDVARGTQRREVVESINAELRSRLGVDAVYTCYHDTADECACRKPKPGMLVQAIEDFGIDAASSYLIGDRKGDIAAGSAIGCTTIFIDRGYIETDSHVNAHERVPSLQRAIDAIVERERVQTRES